MNDSRYSTMHIGKYTLTYNNYLTCFFDTHQNLAVFMSCDYTDVNLILQLTDEQFIIQPKCNIKACYLGENQYLIDVNYDPRRDEAYVDEKN